MPGHTLKNRVLVQEDLPQGDARERISAIAAIPPGQKGARATWLLPDD